MLSLQTDKKPPQSIKTEFISNLLKKIKKIKIYTKIHKNCKIYKTSMKFVNAFNIQFD